MKRRAFLASLAGAFALDPERALWIRGAKTISVPAPRPLVREFLRCPIAEFLDVGDVLQFGGAAYCYEVTEVAGDSFTILRAPVGLTLNWRAGYTAETAIRRVSSRAKSPASSA